MVKIAKRRSTARRKAPAKTRSTSLLEIVNNYLRRDDLYPADRAHAERLKKYPDAAKVWNPLQVRIEQLSPEVWADVPRVAETVYFQEIITARRIADLSGGKPDNLLTLSMHAKSLMEYLKGLGPDLPPPEPAFLRLVPGLEALALKLGEEARKPQLKSRQDEDGSRRKRAFVLLLGHLFKTPDGRLSEAVQESIGVLTEIALNQALNDAPAQIRSIWRNRNR